MKGLGVNLIWAHVYWQVDVELGVRLSVSILYVGWHHPQGEIHVGHQILLAEHQEIDRLSVAEADDHLVQPEQGHHLHCELPICRLVNAKKLLPSLN